MGKHTLKNSLSIINGSFMSNSFFKYICGFSLVLLLHSMAYTQSYSITPNDTLIAEATPDQLTIFDIYMDNTSGTDTLIVHWERVSLDIPDEWDYSLCDLGTCYPGVPDEGMMYPVAPGDQGFLGFNVFPLFVSGTTTLVMRVWEESAPEDTDTLVWVISSDFGTAVNSISGNTVSIYPTIIDQTITIENIATHNSFLNIFDLQGRNVFDEILTTGTNTIDVSDLPKGQYIARILSNNSVVKTQAVIIQ